MLGTMDSEEGDEGLGTHLRLESQVCFFYMLFLNSTNNRFIYRYDAYNDDNYNTTSTITNGLERKAQMMRLHRLGIGMFFFLFDSLLLYLPIIYLLLDYVYTAPYDKERKKKAQEMSTTTSLGL
jgi:hypothetical protein